MNYFITFYRRIPHLFVYKKLSGQWLKSAAGWEFIL